MTISLTFIRRYAVFKGKVVFLPVVLYVKNITEDKQQLELKTTLMQT